MKFPYDDLTRVYCGKVQIGIITREISRVCRMVMLIILVIVLTACNLPRPNSSGAVDVVRVTGTPTKPTTPNPPSDAGGANLNLERSVSFYYSTGSDYQQEVGKIPLVFSEAEEKDYLIVEGTGKTKWTETAEFPACNYTVKADGNVTVTGLFSIDKCMFNLTITTKYSQPVTTYTQSGNCTGSVVFSQSEFISRIELSPDSSREIDERNKEEGWWKVSSVKLSDIKGDAVKFCFLPQELK